MPTEKEKKMQKPMRKDHLRTRLCKQNRMRQILDNQLKHLRPTTILLLQSLNDIQQNKQDLVSKHQHGKNNNRTQYPNEHQRRFN